MRSRGEREKEGRYFVATQNSPFAISNPSTARRANLLTRLIACRSDQSRRRQEGIREVARRVVHVDPNCVPGHPAVLWPYDPYAARALGPMGYRFDVPLASAFRTSAWEIPNCLAIRDGGTPALKAALIALSFAEGKGGPISLIGGLREVLCDAGSFLPRRRCSASTAASNRSNS